MANNKTIKYLSVDDNLLFSFKLNARVNLSLTMRLGGFFIFFISFGENILTSELICKYETLFH